MLKLEGRASSSCPVQCHCKAKGNGSWRTDMFVDEPNRFVADQTEKRHVRLTMNTTEESRLAVGGTS